MQVKEERLESEDVKDNWVEGEWEEQSKKTNKIFVIDLSR